MKHFIKIHLDDAQAGMKLWDNVVDNKGATLLPSGTELTPSIINSLQRRGVDAVHVVDDRVSDADLRIERERVEKRLQWLFRHTRCDATGLHFMQSILRYRLGESS
jgi:hypothetical protein